MSIPDEDLTEDIVANNRLINRQQARIRFTERPTTTQLEEDFITDYEDASIDESFGSRLTTDESFNLQTAEDD